jgi:hypothetical protein
MNLTRTPLFVVSLTLAVVLGAAAPASAASSAAECSADDVLGGVLANLRGPAGTMAVASGTLFYEGERKTVKLAHHVSPEGVEGFQGENLSVNDGLLRKIRLVRGGVIEEATALVFMPSMRQGRKMHFRATRPLFGTGEYHQYLLLPSQALERDYDFTCEPGTDGARVLHGTRKANASFAPYPSLRLRTTTRAATVVVEEAACEGTDEFASFVQRFSDYAEVEPGYWAPRRITLDQVELELSWRSEPVAPWILDTAATFMEHENVP